MPLHDHVISVVEQDQIGWVKVLLNIRFDIMNTTNHSMGFTPFQLHFGRSPCIFPPLFPRVQKTSADDLACELLEWMQMMVYEAQDNLLSAKVSQAFHTNKSWTLNFPFKVGKHVVLLTLHRHWKFRAGDPNCVAKFMPWFDGPFVIKAINERHSTVTLDLPNLPNIFPVFHTSEVHPFAENNDSMFPSQALKPPDPVTVNGQQEFFIDKIVNKWMHGKKKLYQVRWQGEGPKGDLWLPVDELMDCEVLDLWLSQKRSKPGVSYVHSYGPASSFFPWGF